MKLHHPATTAVCLTALAGLLALTGRWPLPAAHADDKLPGDRRSGVMYVVTNDPVKDGNAVLGYRNDGRGNLTPLPGSPFRTGGTGYATKHELPHFGPFDSDQNLVATPDRRRVFATNGGSDTVAVMDVADDGSLKAVEGSPFPSGGKNPVSLGLAGDKVYVVNKNEDPGRDMTKTLPNYTGFTIGKDGRLDAIKGARVELKTAWRSPTQALVVRDKFIFDGDFGSFYLPSREAMWGKGLRQDTPSTIRSLRIKADGALEPLSPLSAPEGAFVGGLDTDKDGKPDPLMFGLQAHPKEKLVYVCFVTAAKLAVYEYDDEGRLTFLRAVPNSGELICWLVVNATGTRAYTSNNASDTVSVYDLSDPRKPVEIQHLHLKGHGHPYQLALDPREKFLYTVKHRTFKETPVGDGSVLNVLEVLPTGKLREVPSSPVTLPVRDDLLARPQGVLAF
jgi:DNA-binding beta-propeller fold protein YncE